jgi:phage gpG-like protein
VANESRKILQAKKEMYVAINAMREDMTKKAKKHFDDSFVNEGFTYNSLMKWRERKRPDRYKHKILQKTGRLRRSVKTNTFSTKTYFEVRFRSNTPYSSRHNDGLDGMPKRQFMGYSPALNKRLTVIFDRRIKNIFRP